MSLLFINLMASMKNKKIVIVLIILAFIAGSFFYFSNRIYYSHGTSKQATVLEIKKGENAVEIGKRLKEDGLISNYIYFVYYIWSRDIKNKIMAGRYKIDPRLTIPEIAKAITEGETDSNQVKITFPEGWDSKKMELRIRNNGLKADDFLDLVKNKEYFEDKYNYEFLADIPEEQGLEGYLFPDTYFFYKDANAEEIIKKMLDNFDEKMTGDLRQETKSREKSIFEIITMASMIENEVKTKEDRKIVSDIFWGRISIGQPLQSSATLTFILGVNKRQYSYEDTRIKSPYNTYMNKGLPPGPISNPGVVSIKTAIYPTATDYNYFLNNPETGETVFSKTLEEHNANKDKHGL